MILIVNKKKFPVRDLKHASVKFQQHRGTTPSKFFPRGAQVVDDNGKPVAMISYNGRVWEAHPEGSGKTIMDPAPLIMEAIDPDSYDLVTGESISTVTGAPADTTSESASEQTSDPAPPAAPKAKRIKKSKKAPNTDAPDVVEHATQETTTETETDASAPAPESETPPMNEPTNETETQIEPDTTEGTDDMATKKKSASKSKSTKAAKTPKEKKPRGTPRTRKDGAQTSTSIVRAIFEAHPELGFAEVIKRAVDKGVNANTARGTLVRLKNPSGEKRPRPAKAAKAPKTPKTPKAKKEKKSRAKKS